MGRKQTDNGIHANGFAGIESDRTSLALVLIAGSGSCPRTFEG